tara:strand:+ start:71 stop:250 length:180 start_codon:yes stop_codon:yes gene_type:complete
MIKILITTLLILTTVPATATPNLCKEIEAVLWESVRDGYIKEQVAIKIASNCSLETEQP